MLNIVIFYYSGVGSTKYVANRFYSIVEKHRKVDLYSIENLPCDFQLSNYDALIIGFPTIHTEPAKPILDFLEKLPALSKSLPAFIFTTCGLYSANTLRIFAKKCLPLNIIPVLCKTYRCIATDGALLAPFMNCWFKHEKNLHSKIEDDAVEFMEQLQNPMQPIIPAIPKIKLYSILNYPNKVLGQNHTFTIYLHKNQCVTCNKCIENCPTHAYERDAENYPVFIKSQCINCYRCIHHCPKAALSLSAKHVARRTLYGVFGK